MHLNLAVLAFLALLIVSGTVHAEHSEPIEHPAEDPQAVFITSTHQVGFAVIHEKPTNTSAEWDSPFLPFSNLTIWIVGLNSSYNITVGGIGNVSGVTNDTVSRFRISLANLTTVNVIVIVDNITFNFGTMIVAKEPHVITPDRLIEPVITEREHKELLLQSRIGTYVSTIATLGLVFIWIGKIKRGRIKIR